MKDSFVFYRSFFEAIHKVKDKDLKADIFEAVCELALNEKDIEINDCVGQIIMELIKPQIVANNERYSNGKKGGRPKKNHRLSKKETIGYQKEKPNVNENENVNVNVNVNDNDNENVYLNNNDNITKYCMDEFGRLLSSIEVEKLNDYEKIYGKEKVKLAIKQCCLNNKRTINYLQGILKNWVDKSLDDITTEKNNKKITKKEIEDSNKILDYDWLESEN